MRKREFETERGTLRYWVSENNEETAQLVFPIIQTGRVPHARGLSSAPRSYLRGGLSEGRSLA